MEDKKMNIGQIIAIGGAFMGFVKIGRASCRERV